MKTQHVLISLLLIIWSISVSAQYPTGGNKGYDPDGNVRGRSHYDDDDDEGPYRQNGTHIQLALLLDASGSMNGLIDQAKAQLWNVVNELTYAYEGYGYPTIEISVYEYGKNELGRRSGFMRQVVPFTTELDWVAEGLYSIYTGGNQEYCGEVIETATQELRWSYKRSAIKMIYIAGNEDFTQGSVDYRRAIRQATQKGISVNTIFCGPYRDGIYKHWQDAAEVGGGYYTNINQNSRYYGRQQQQDPYLSSLNNRLNDTYIPYGSYGQKNYLRMQQQDRNASSYGQHNLAQRTITKASPAYNTTQWDLVSAVSAGTVNLASIPTNELPPAMQSMSLAQKEQFIARKKQERDQVSREIAKVGKEQKATITQQEKIQGGGPTQENMTLDQAIIQSNKHQLKKGGGTIEVKQAPRDPAPSTQGQTSQQKPRVITQPERTTTYPTRPPAPTRTTSPPTGKMHVPATRGPQGSKEQVKKAPKLKYPFNN